MNQLTELLPKIFCVEIPDDTVAWEMYDKESLPLAILIFRKDPKGLFKPGFPEPIYPIPPGTYSILFASKDAGEEDWELIVKKSELWKNKGFVFENYNQDNDHLTHCLTATESGLSLLTSKGLDLNKNYLVIKQID